MSEILPVGIMFKVRDKSICYIDEERVSISRGALGQIIGIDEDEISANNPLYTCRVNCPEVDKQDVYLYKKDMILIRSRPYNTSIRSLRRII